MCVCSRCFSHRIVACFSATRSLFFLDNNRSTAVASFPRSFVFQVPEVTDTIAGLHLFLSRSFYL